MLSAPFLKYVQNRVVRADFKAPSSRREKICAAAKIPQDEDAKYKEKMR